MRTVIISFALGLVAAVGLAKQPAPQPAPQSSGKPTKNGTWAPPRTPDGQPDLQGV
jgi:hypothetical protein